MSGATPCAKPIGRSQRPPEEGASVAGNVDQSKSVVFNPSEGPGCASGWSRGCSGVISWLRVSWDEVVASEDANHWSAGSCANNPASGIGSSNELGVTSGNAGVRGAAVGSLDEDEAFGKRLSKGFDIRAARDKTAASPKSCSSCSSDFGMA